MFLKKDLYAFGVLLLALNGCGSSNSTTSNLSNNTTTKVGYVIDAPVANLDYKCGDKTAKTGSDGKFECTTLPATFFIGNIEIGSISTINSDTKVFVQDIVKIDRSDFNNTKVLKLAILLQSLDKDKNSSNSISIPDNLNLSSTKSFDDLSLTELNTLLTISGFTPISSEDAEQHLREFSDIDTLAPTLKLNGESSVSISKNEAYKELGATAKDDRDNNLTIVITGSVKTDTVGSYILKYNVSDKTGNKAKELTRTVTVKEIVPVVVNASNLDISKEGDITPVIFNSTGGAITSCSISPALPTGLTLSDDCQITGATSSYLPSTAYTITATNDAGSTTATINISVAILANKIDLAEYFENSNQVKNFVSIYEDTKHDGEVKFSFSDTVVVTDNVIKHEVFYEPNAIIVIGEKDINVTDIYNGYNYLVLRNVNLGEEISSFNSSSSILSEGFNVDTEYSEKCFIDEKLNSLTATSKDANYTYEGDIIAQVCTSTINETIRELKETVTHTDVKYSYFQKDKGRIALINKDCRFPYKNTNPDHNGTFSMVDDKSEEECSRMTITQDLLVEKVIVPLPKLENASDINISQAGDIEPIIFNNTGGAITSCSISPALPTGLTLSDDCKITGTTTSFLPSTAYTITATNDAGSATATINIAIALPPSTVDELLTDQWYIKNTGTAPDTWGKFTNLTKNADLNVTAAWNQGVRGEGVVVTVVDDGADFTHKDLINQEKKGYRVNLETGSSSDFELTDSDSHGTGCAGIIAAQGNNGGVIGIAPKAQLTAHGTRNGYNHEISYEKMLEDNISRVSNHSYGPYDNGILYPQSTEEYDSIKALVTKSHNGKGHVMLFASGNGRDSGPSRAEKYGDYAGLDMSQQNPYVISVSGFGATDQEISYAEAGPATLVAGATGETFNYYLNHSIKPLTAPMATTGLSHINYAESTESFRDDGTPEPTGYNMAFDGTSAATPTVTGTAALILAANPDLTWRDVRWILAKTARKIQLNGKVINQASGEESSENYWLSSGNATFGQYSHYFGYGAADAGAAVKLAKSDDYTLLPVQKECELNDDDGVVLISAECPNTIEFVRVKFEVSEDTNINEMTLKMQLNNNADKEILLLRPTYCSEGNQGCVVREDTNVTSGTVGFLGDSIKTNDTFNFAVTDTDGNSEAIELKKITVMGYDK